LTGVFAGVFLESISVCRDILASIADLLCLSFGHKAKQFFVTMTPAWTSQASMGYF
jgi:hypothetical protein